MAVALPRPSGRRGSLERREARAGLLFVLPWLVSLLVFTTYPVFGTLGLAFTEYNVVEPPRWVGLDNFWRMFGEDQDFRTAVGNSDYYAAISLPLRLVLVLALV